MTEPIDGTVNDVDLSIPGYVIIEVEKDGVIYKETYELVERETGGGQ